ncbi:MAG TPA: AMP-binding protein [Kofleriaceae bacterium]|nr:AMP-binding protein [Kofleriaceae bacterium]
MKPIVLAPRLHPDDLDLIESALVAERPLVLIPPRLPPEESERLRRAVPDALPAGVAAVLFTSGSTGQRKGVLLDRAALAASAAASAAVLGRREDDRWLLCLSPATVGGLSIVTRSLAAGRRALLAGGGDRFEPAGLVGQIARDRVTLLSLVPTMLARLLELDWRPPAHLRAVLIGGAAADPALLARARERGVPVRTTYGMTETASHVAIDGRVLPGLEVAIQGGRIAVRGPVLFRGYLPPHDHIPARDAGGWFVTADRGALDPDGVLRVLGRADGAILSGGATVDPAAVEAALTAVPGIGAACVFGLPDPEWGERVAAAVVLTGADLPPGLAGALRGRLSPHELPRRIAVLADLPLGPSGKLDRAEIARRSAGRLRPLV